MFMKNYIILFLYAIVLLCSCTSKDGDKEILESGTENLSKSLDENRAVDKTIKSPASEMPDLGVEEIISYNDQEFYLTLDNITPLFNYHSQPVIIDNKMKILWYNQQNNSLDFYGLTSKAIDKRVQFELNGPNALPGMRLGAGVNFVNSDTIILFSGQLKRIYLTNLSGDIYSKVDLSRYAHGFGSIAMESPIAYRKGYVYIQLMPNIPLDSPDFYSPDYNRIAKIDLKSGEFEEFYIDLPSEVIGADISQLLKMMNIIYNSKSDKFIISFPLSDKIIVTDFENYKKEYSAKSGLIKDIIKLDRKEKSVPAASLSSFYYWLNSSYEKMIFDPINNLYYREARKGISDEAFIERNFTQRREVIVLDSDFSKIGTLSFNSSGIYYYFYAKDYFFYNKDLQEFNLKNGVEDSIFFHSQELSF
jgi:hypothetical protein